MAPAVDGAVGVLSQRGGDFEITIGEDFSIGYAGQTPTRAASTSRRRSRSGSTHPSRGPPRLPVRVGSRRSRVQVTTRLTAAPTDAHRHAGAHVHRRAADHAGHHARPFGEVDERDCGHGCRLERRRSVGAMTTACTVARPDAWAVPEAERGVRHATRGKCTGISQRGTTAAGAASQRVASQYGELALGRPWPEPGHSVASVPRTIVDMHERMNPAPWATATSAPST